MILFIFEGDEREPAIYKTLERLYFPRHNDNIICCFGNNIYNLYNEMKGYGDDGDIVGVMKERLAVKPDSPLAGIRRTDISETFLFFDYDFHHTQLPLEEINRRVEEMLNMFSDETDKGKLYINYPMIESIRYTKQLPDEKFIDYVVTREESHDFKRLSHTFSFYKNYDHILFKHDEHKPDKDRYLTVKDNWGYLIRMNVSKAKWLITNNWEWPVNKEDISQPTIFKSQKMRYIEPDASVSVLNAFPMFLYEYMKHI